VQQSIGLILLGIIIALFSFDVYRKGHTDQIIALAFPKNKNAKMFFQHSVTKKMMAFALGLAAGYFIFFGALGIRDYYREKISEPTPIIEEVYEPKYETEVKADET